MLNLRAHHTLCLIIPDYNDFQSLAWEKFRNKGYTDIYIKAYMKAFETARKNENEDIMILSNPKNDDTCKRCGNYVDGVCISPHALTFTKWDKEILTLFNLNAGDIIKVSDLRRLVKEKVNPQNMPGVCKDCLFDFDKKCREILIMMR
ncbi:MAG: DUF1284 domain-containing protein [Candidatus Bathyarchaeia archaeon]